MHSCVPTLACPSRTRFGGFIHTLHRPLTVCCAETAVWCVPDVRNACNSRVRRRKCRSRRAFSSLRPPRFRRPPVADVVFPGPETVLDVRSMYITRTHPLYMHIQRTLPVGKTEPRLFVVPNAHRRRTVPLRARPGRRPRTTCAFDPRKFEFVASKQVQAMRGKHIMRVCPCYTAFGTLNGIPIPGLEPTFMLYARRHACFRTGSLRHAEISGNRCVSRPQNGRTERSTPVGRRRQIGKNGFSEIYSRKVRFLYFLAFLLGVPSPQ